MAGPEILLLFAVGMFCGGLNAIVGGGTLICFPVLLGLGLPPIAANATNTIGLWPASLAAAHTYLPELKTVRAKLLPRGIVAVAGGTVGALALIASGDALFFQLVPWLISIATLLFGFSRVIVQQLTKLGAQAGAVLVLSLEFLFAIYGGYFGAGIGVLLMAALALAGERDPQIANAQKNLLGGLINGAAVVVFVWQGAVVWGVAIAVAAGAVVGGHFGGRVARIIPAAWLRIGVLAAGATLAIVYFQRAYFG